MIFSDLPSPAEAPSHAMNTTKGFAQAGNRVPLFGTMLYYEIGFREGLTMRAFFAAVVVAAVIAVVGGVVLAKFQEPVSEAYSTQGVRL